MVVAHARVICSDSANGNGVGDGWTLSEDYNDVNVVGAFGKGLQLLYRGAIRIDTFRLLGCLFFLGCSLGCSPGSISCLLAFGAAILDSYSVKTHCLEVSAALFACVGYSDL
jgi:hypothetical protein